MIHDIEETLIENIKTMRNDGVPVTGARLCPFDFCDLTIWEKTLLDLCVLAKTFGSRDRENHAIVR